MKSSRKLDVVRLECESPSNSELECSLSKASRAAGDSSIIKIHKNCYLRAANRGHRVNSYFHQSRWGDASPAVGREERLKRIFQGNSRCRGADLGKTNDNARGVGNSKSRQERAAEGSRKTVLITGGTGFLGKRLALDLKNEYRVVLGGRDNKRNLVAQQFTGCEVVPMDVASIESLRDAVVSTRPQIIIHAAATKFVDLAEMQPMECVDVNVIGSQNVARVAVDKGVETVIGVSTDKASPPVRNTYGLSKALMERLFCSMDGKTDTRFCCVRYGNVAWSTGSVFPIWKRMHEQTGVIGTTGPEMRRFFFTVDEAVRLVMTALTNIEDLNGKVLSRKMKSARIADVLRVWIDNKGGRWEHIQGRPGERDDEFLIGELELPYTSETVYDGIPHFVISFNEKVSEPATIGLSSANAEKLTDPEILNIIDNPPVEELGGE